MKKAFGFEIEQVSSIDIDDIFDYHVTSFLSKKLLNIEKNYEISFFNWKSFSV